jgi:hypothetical protein
MDWPLASTYETRVSEVIYYHLLPRITDLLLCRRRRSFDSISTLDHIGFEADRPGASMKLEEQAAGVA